MEYYKTSEAQIISYLKLTNKKPGFLINFNVPFLKDGLKRYVNNFYTLRLCGSAVKVFITPAP